MVGKCVPVYSRDGVVQISDNKNDAGLKLCQLVHSEDPTLPFLMQSSQESMRERAEELGAGFILKTSKTLTHELSEYIGERFGFGDFVVPDPETGAIVAAYSVFSHNCRITCANASSSSWGNSTP